MNRPFSTVEKIKQMRKSLMLVIFFAVFAGNNYILSQPKPGSKKLVRIRIVEEDTKKVTPAMVCITNSKRNEVHTPPLGELVGKVTDTDDFFKGVEFSEDKNWIGPVRMTDGVGNNKDRSVLYGIKPSIPYWKAPVMYQTSGDFSIELPAGVWKISIQHGNEYLPVVENISIKNSDKEISKTYVLKRWINLPELGWYSGDVHVHHPPNRAGL